MANLRADNLCGPDGRNAIDGSVFFDGSRSYLTMISGEIISGTGFGTNDFTVEFWINQGVNASDYTGIFNLKASTTTDRFQVAFQSSTIQVYTDTGTWRDTGYAPVSGQWEHIAFVRSYSGNTLKMYANGVEKWSVSNTRDYDEEFETFIGLHGSTYGYLEGYLSNLRVVNGTALYTTNNFTPPTEKLTAIDGTVLLCCQDSDNPTAEASGKEIVGFGACYYGKRYSNIATNGDLETGDTTGWTNNGCATFEVTTGNSHSGTYSLHCLSDSNGDGVSYSTTVNTSLRYKISAYMKCVGPLGTSAKAKMKIGDAFGDSTNYESQTVGYDSYKGFDIWDYVEWIGRPTSATTIISFVESSANNANEWYVDDLRVEIWFPEENQNILANPKFLTGATGWSFTNGNSPSSEWTIGSEKLTVTDQSRTNDAYASQQIYSSSFPEGKYRFTIDYSLTTGAFDAGVGNSRIWGIGNSVASASVTHEVTADDNNSNFRIVANQYCAGYFNSITLYRVAEPKRNNPTPPYGVDEGVTFEGDIKMNSQGHMYFPTGDTSQRGRGTALFAGGYITPNATADIEYLSIPSGGTTTKWGNLSTTQLSAGQSLSSKTRQLIGGGWASPINNNTINYITIATSGNSLEFGDLVVGRRGSSPVSNDTRGIWGGGYISPADAGTPTLDYVQIATIGNAADFGDLSGNALGGTATGSTTRGVFALGNVAPSDVNTLEYITIASTGDYTNFGDLPSGSFGRYNGSTSSNTRGIFAGGHYPTSVNIINYITIATTGDATEFGDLFLARSFPSGTSNGIRGVFMGGTTNPARQDTIDSVIIATTGNAVNWGDMRVATQIQNGSSSDSHGGLS